MLRTNPDKLQNFHDQRFERSPREGLVRIVALGGSSVNWIDSNVSRWRRSISTRLPGQEEVQVINCGGTSYGSHRLVLVAKEVLTYDVDVLAIYMGHNEFQELEQLQLAYLDTLALQKLASHSGLYRVIRDFVARRQIHLLERAAEQGTLAEAKPELLRIEHRDFTAEEIAERTAEFRRNLERIVKMAHSHGARVVLGTVPSNYMNPELPPEKHAEWKEIQALYDAGEWEAGKERVGNLLTELPRSQSSPLENGIIREIAEAYDTGLADVEAAIIAAEPHGVPGEKFFNDHCHLNEAGNNILEKVFEDAIVATLSED
jgi:hypothetical protein